MKISHNGRKNLEYNSKIHNSKLGYLIDLISSVSYHIISKWYSITQICSNCGFKFTDKQKLTLDDRLFKCPICNNEIDRDLNSSINILNIGLKESL